jgi:hypothetical protein
MRVYAITPVVYYVFRSLIGLISHNSGCMPHRVIALPRSGYACGSMAVGT